MGNVNKVDITIFKKVYVRRITPVLRPITPTWVAGTVVSIFIHLFGFLLGQ